jgi:glycosyltransferase involved in cell wall biosynthesis
MAQAMDNGVSARTILHIISGLGIGGAEAALAQVATALQARGLPQHIVCVGAVDNRAGVLRSSGVEVTVLGIDSAVRVPRGLFRLARLIRRLDPMVVQGWMYHGNILAALAHRMVGRSGRRRLYWNLRASNMDTLRYGGIIRAGAILSAWPDMVIANSMAGVKFHDERGFHPRRVEVILNGIDTQKFRPDAQARAALRAEFGIPADAVVAIHAARVDPMKDHSALLAAMAAVPQLHGLLVGAGTEALTVPDNVYAIGLRHDLPRLYAAADIVVSSSAFGEGFSNVVAEGMSAGLIPVATDVGDAREIIGDTGDVVAPGDRAALAGALAAVTGCPAEERRARGMRSRARIVERFPLGAMIDAYSRLYNPDATSSSWPAVTSSSAA